MPAKRSQKKSSQKDSFPVVAIGASAGGLEAILTFLKKLSPTTGMAFVYVQHLDPNHESKLTQILAYSTKMKVVEAGHRMPLEPNTVYVIPPNKDMSAADGALILNARKTSPGVHHPIDQFFISLAETYEEKSIGILLSGTATDGTAGLRAIKSAGGLTIAQDETAKFQSMPKTAIAERVVDMVLSPEQIAREVERLGKDSNLVEKSLMGIEEEAAQKGNEHILAIFQLLKKATGVDFSHYKANTVKRRIMRRMLIYKLGTLEEYVQYLRQNKTEVNTLYQDLLINVTSFFRDADGMEYLKKTLLPRILKSKPVGEPIRIWIPACSTGEEAYSIAIVLLELLGDRIVNIPIQVFATDLSEIAINKARIGLYNLNDLQNISPKRIQRFFMKVDGGYRIVKTIRDLIVFAPHNVFKDPPFSRMDLISCCNLMIYLDNYLQKKILSTFHYALNHNGYLMLGKSETIGTALQLFTQQEKKFKIYGKKKEVASKAIFEMNYRIPEIESENNADKKKKIQKPLEPQGNLEKSVDEILLRNFIPASVVVNHDLEILMFRGSTSLYLEPSPGKASLNLLKMARPGLAFELKNAVHKATRSGQSIKKSGLEIKVKDVIHNISIEVHPLKPDGDENLFLVIFNESPEPGVAQIKSNLSKDKLVKQLQEELQTVREDMRSIIEEQEASNEELQSANEEIVSSNEELQSINEELETSKEEMESANEELMTINSELQERNEQLEASYEYSEVLFNTISESVLFLDKDLRVKSANKSFYKTFKESEESTEGRLIYELADKQWNIPGLRILLDKVMTENSQFNGYEVKHVFPEIGEKILLLNARRVIRQLHGQQLILLAIEDITEYRRAEAIISEREAWMRNMLNSAPVLIRVSYSNNESHFFNKSWLDYTGKKQQEESKEGWMKEIHPKDLDKYLEVSNSNISKRQAFQAEYRLRRHDGEYRWIQEVSQPTFSSSKDFSGFISSCTDIHDKKMANEELEERVEQRTLALQETNRELERSNSELEQFAYVASHDLQEPLRKIVSFSDRLQKLENEIPATGVGYITKITDSAERMTNLIDDLLNFSRISKSTGHIEKIDLNKVLKDILIDLDLVVKEKKASIQVDKLPVIEAVHLQMEQLFHNLISNALKFSKPGIAPKIKIQPEAVSEKKLPENSKWNEPDDYIAFSVSDNGIGFEDEFAEQIFVIFQRLNSSRQYPGTGIGLALCKKIVVNHGGEIYAKSREGEGASFHIILPIKQS